MLTIEGGLRLYLGHKIPASALGNVGVPMAMTLAQKLWNAHVVRSSPGEPDLLYVDLHLVHEVTSPQAFEGLRLSGRRVRRPDLTLATMDHNVPTRGGARAADRTPPPMGRSAPSRLVSAHPRSSWSWPRSACPKPAPSTWP